MMGCTTGAKVLRPGHEFVLFKNRDFSREHYDDRFSLTDTAFGALGLETWDASDPDGDRLSGFSIGFNAHLACCDSNVRTVSGGDNYDKLVQAVVENCTTIDQAIVQVRRLAADQLFCWANMIVATAGEIAALEVRDHHVEVERNPSFLARANHHVCLGATPEDDDTDTTPFRYQVAYEGLRTAKRVEDIFTILRSHQPDPQHGICNHSQYNTVYSYAVHWKDSETTFYVLQGRPCAGGEYVKLPIAFGKTNDLSRYPSRYALEQVRRNA
jgi:predicted choloylglycine hydrolase